MVNIDAYSFDLNPGIKYKPREMVQEIMQHNGSKHFFDLIVEYNNDDWYIYDLEGSVYKKEDKIRVKIDKDFKEACFNAYDEEGQKFIQSIFNAATKQSYPVKGNEDILKCKADDVYKVVIFYKGNKKLFMHSIKDHEEARKCIEELYTDMFEKLGITTVSKLKKVIADVKNNYRLETKKKNNPFMIDPDSIDEENVIKDYMEACKESGETVNDEFVERLRQQIEYNKHPTLPVLVDMGPETITFVSTVKNEELNNI